MLLNCTPSKGFIYVSQNLKPNWLSTNGILITLSFNVAFNRNRINVFMWRRYLVSGGASLSVMLLMSEVHTHVTLYLSSSGHAVVGDGCVASPA